MNLTSRKSDNFNLSQVIIKIMRINQLVGAKNIRPAVFLKDVANKSQQEKLEILKALKEFFDIEDYTQVEQEILRGEKA